MKYDIDDKQYLVEELQRKALMQENLIRNIEEQHGEEMASKDRDLQAYAQRERQIISQHH